MKKGTLFATALMLGLGFALGAFPRPPFQASAPHSQAVRPIGVVTEIQPGRLTIRTDAGPSMVVQLPEGIMILRVPPGAKDLKSATRISVSDLAAGDRVFVKGEVSEDEKSVVAKSMIVMSKSALAEAHQEESLEWERHGIEGVVKAVDPASKQITIAVPNNPPTPANPTHPVTISVQPNAVLLRYAPDSVKFSDAKPSSFEDIQVGDQVRALGTRSADGSHFTAEKLVSGTFRNIGATVISADAAADTITVKDLANGKPLLVRTNADSKLHTLPPFVAMMIARFNSGGSAGGRMAGGTQGSRPGAAQFPGGGFRGGRMGGAGGGMPGGPPHDFNQMLDHMPRLSLGDLKPGEPVIVVSTEGAKPGEVTAIAVLSGVEPILEARPKGSQEVRLGPWNMSMGGGGGGEEGGGEQGP